MIDINHRLTARENTWIHLSKQMDSIEERLDKLEHKDGEAV